MTLKTPPEITVATHMLELLLTRIWLTNWNREQTLDLPAFVPRENLCAEQIKHVREEWTSNCVPVQINVNRNDDSTVLELRMTADQNPDTILKQAKVLLERGTLGPYVIEASDGDRLRNQAIAIIKQDNDLTELFDKGWLDISGQTFPALETFFAAHLETNRDVLLRVLDALLATTAITKKLDFVQEFHIELQNWQ